MSAPTTKTKKLWNASELRKLPQRQRGVILQAAAKLAEVEYRNDSDLTAFAAFAKDDLHGDSANTDAR